MENQKQVIEALKNEASSNPAANAVFLVLATRDRSRGTLTMKGLDQKMRLEGFVFKSSDYARILRLLATLGFGKLVVDNKGAIQGLRDIKVTLQSIGQVACGQAALIKGFSSRNKYVPLVAAPEVKKQLDRIPVKARLNVVLDFNGNRIDIPIPAALTPEQALQFIKELEKVGGSA